MCSCSKKTETFCDELNSFSPYQTNLAVVLETMQNLYGLEENHEGVSIRTILRYVKSNFNLLGDSRGRVINGVMLALHRGFLHRKGKKFILVPPVAKIHFVAHGNKCCREQIMSDLSTHFLMSWKNEEEKKSAENQQGENTAQETVKDACSCTSVNSVKGILRVTCPDCAKEKEINICRDKKHVKFSFEDCPYDKDNCCSSNCCSESTCE